MKNSIEEITKAISWDKTHRTESMEMVNRAISLLYSIDQLASDGNYPVASPSLIGGVNELNVHNIFHFNIVKGYPLTAETCPNGDYKISLVFSEHICLYEIVPEDVYNVIYRDISTRVYSFPRTQILWG